MTTTAIEVPTLRTNLAEYPVTKAMKDGRVTSDIVKLDFCGPTPAHNGFKAMVRESAFDAGELAIVTFLQAKAYGKPYVMLPTPISGRFQHHCAGFNIDFVQVNPKDIEGKRVGVRTYTQTTALWIRGILRHEYGVVRTLVPNAQAAAKDWYAREGIVPINHMFVVHEDISKKRPDIVRELYRMIVASRARTESGVPAIFPPIGLEANRKGLQLTIDWALDQKIIPHHPSVDELFDDVTGNLG